MPAPASASRLDPDAAERLHRTMDRLLAHCGEMSASQEAILARTPFFRRLGGHEDEDEDEEEEEEEEEEEVFTAPPLTQQDPQSQGGQAGTGQAGITMRTQPSPSSPPAAYSSSDREEQQEQVNTPTPIPSPKINTPTPIPGPGPGPELDPLIGMVLNIPTAPVPPPDPQPRTLARSPGIFPPIPPE